MRWRVISRTVVLAALAGTLCVGGTTAYFSAFDQVKNRTAAGRNTTEILENFPETDEPGDEKIQEYKKTVRVTNISPAENGFNVDCYVRVSLSYSNYDIGKAVTLLGLDTVNWKYDSRDGYYYYRKILKEEESTTALFTGFQIDRERVDTLYQDYLTDFQIDVYEESVAAGTFLDYESAWEYYLNPIQST